MMRAVIFFYEICGEIYNPFTFADDFYINIKTYNMKVHAKSTKQGGKKQYLR